MRFQFQFRQISTGLAENGAQRSSIEFDMGGNGQDLGVTLSNSLEFHVVTALRDEHETELLQYADDLVPRQLTRLGHESDRSRR